MVSARPQLDVLPPEQVIHLLIDAEARVVPAVRRASAELAKAVALLSPAFAAGRRVVFVGAGTSGRIAAAEAAELPGTFGIPAACCPAVVAGLDTGRMDDAAEDDEASGTAGIRALELSAGDVVVAVAASGRTGFTVAAAKEARAAGAAVVAVVNIAGSPLVRIADVAVELVVGEEVLRGSTRLTAGTAQKVALNTLTTTALAATGRVYGDLMVDVVPANEKLRDRAAGIVAEIAGCSAEDAAAALAACSGDARAAVLHLARGLLPGEARARAAAQPSLRAALEG